VSAVALLEASLAELCAGDHQLWPNLAAAHVRSLAEAERTEEAAAAGASYLVQADGAQLGFNTNYILLPLCAAEAKLGLVEAVSHAERVIQAFECLGTTGLNLGLAYEARARVALEQGDRAAYQTYFARCEAVFSAGSNAALSAKCQKLKRDAQRKQIVPAAPQVDPAVQRAIAQTMFQSKLRSCRGPVERAELMLALLAERSGSTEGFLYRATESGPLWVATLGPHEPSKALEAMVHEYLAGELRGHQLTTGDNAEVHTQWSAFGEALHRPVLLSHYGEHGYVITGLAVFSVSANEAFTYPTDIAALVSRMSMEAGDVTGLIVTDD